MKLLAILAVIVGGLELANIVGDFVVGHSGRTVGSDTIDALVALASIGLMVSGVVLLKGQRASRRIAMALALFALLVFGGIAAFQPFLSIASSLLGIVFSLVLFAMLLRGSASGDSRATS